MGCLVGLFIAHHVGDSHPQKGVGAVVGVLQGEGVRVPGARALASSALQATQQLPPSGLLQRHLSSENRRPLAEVRTCY